MAEHHTAMVISLIAVVLFSQMTIFLVTEYHFPCNSKNTLTIILILLQSSITSTIKVSIVSPIAAILTSILCFITLLYFAIVNSQEPGNMKDIITVFWFAIAMVCVVVFAFILPDYDVGFSLQ
jgi:hypothetical protein